MERVEKIKGFRPWMLTRLKGQPEVIDALEAVAARGEQGLSDPQFVRGAYIFAGPTGVGKTESLLRFAEYFFGPGYCLKLNMSEFKQAAHVTEVRDRLVAALRRGCRVFMLDEIEKAHWEVCDLLLQILDKGAELAAADGAPVTFSECYFGLTTNLGAKEAMRSRTLIYELYAGTIREHVRRYLRPEILGRVLRLGGVVVLRRLQEPEQREVVAFHLGVELQRMQNLGYRLSADATAFEFFMRRGFSVEYGARSLLGLMQRSVQDAVAAALLAGIDPQGMLVLRSDGEGLAVTAGKAATVAA